MSNYSRREFIRLGGLTALAMAGTAAGAALKPPAALAAGLIGDVKIYRRSELMMGTYVTITLVDDSLVKTEEAAQAAFDEIERLTAILSRYETGGPLAHLARTGRLASPEPELVGVLEAAARFHRATKGGFDVTVAPLIDRVRDSFAQTGAPPSQAELASLLRLVDGDAVRVSAREIRLMKDGMALTLDGLAKGYIVDSAAAVLRRHGVDQGLINAGGDIVALGKKGRRPWRVAIIDPTRPGGRGPVIELADRAVATSGNYEVYYDAEKLHHHIIDPATGASPYGPVSATVKAADCLTADALSTSLFCLPSSQGVGLLSSLAAEGLIINRRGQRLKRGRWS